MKKYLLPIVIGCIIFLSPGQSIAQKKKNRNKFYSGSQLSPSRQPYNSFLASQVWLGLKAGTNLTEILPGTRHSIYSPIGNQGSSLDKSYESFNKPGIQAGLEFMFAYRSIGISLQPNFRRQTFAYSNQYFWNDEDPSNNIELNYYFTQSLDYLDLPLLVKYEFVTPSVRPYLQVGGYYGWLLGANKSVKVDGVDRASGGSRFFEKEAFSLGVKELYSKHSAGILGGIGINYDIGNIRVNFNVVYRYGLTEITDKNARYSETRLTGLGDIPDDMNLNNISFDLGLLFPMKFLSSNYSAIE